MVQIIKSLVRRVLKGLSLGFYLPRTYAKAARQSVVPGKVLFAGMKESEMPDAFKVLYEKLESGYSFDLSFVSLKQNESSLIRYYKNCIAFLKDMATAQYVFLEDASDVVSCVDLRSETKVVQLWHACGAFKKWGMSTADLKFGGTRDELLRHPFYKNLSLVTVSSPEVIWAYAEAMALEDQKEIIQPLGVSRTDRFFNKTFLLDARISIEATIPAVKDKKVILYAPTFRGRVAHAEGPDRLDIAKLKQSLGDDYILIIKHHPFVKQRPAIPSECVGFAFDVSDELPIDVLLCCADMCISDYSSLVFEYSLFEKPMLFFAYDIDDYDDWRGFYYDYNSLTPGPICMTTDEVVFCIKGLENGFDASEIVAFKNKFMSACDGRSTDRIMCAVFEEELERFGKSTKPARATV